MISLFTEVIDRLGVIMERMFFWTTTFLKSLFNLSSANSQSRFSLFSKKRISKQASGQCVTIYDNINFV